jgi:hypothetical protein
VAKPTARILWLGGKPLVMPFTKKKRDLLRMTFQDKTESFQITLEPGTGLWLQGVLEKISVHQPAVLTFSEFKEDFANHQLEDFESFWYSPSADKLKAHGLLCL